MTIDAGNTNPTRRWYQFRLRTLMTVLTVLTIAFAFVGSEVADALRDRAVARWVIESGGLAYYEDGWLTSVSFQGDQVTDLSPLAGQKRLVDVDLRSASITDLTSLAGLKNLEVLNLSYTRVSDLSPLADLKNLRVLYLNNTQVSDLSALAGLANLKLLYMEETHVNREQVDILKKSLPSCGIYCPPFDELEAKVSDE